MNRTIRNFAVFLLVLSINITAYAQDDANKSQSVQIDIPEVAIVDLEATAGTAINLAITAPSEAGSPLDFSSAVDSSIWLNYSSVRGRPSEPNRTIRAKIASGSLPNYLRLHVAASADQGYGDGDMGNPTNGKNLGSNDKTIVKQIKTCYTGDGVGRGHRLYYSLQLKNNRYNRIDFDDSGTNLTVLYTISDD